jgi:UDP-glucose 4-epimerase
VKILVTGGAGYIGSHTCIELINSGYDVVVVDNLNNSSFESIKRIEKIINYKIPFYQIDIRDKQALTNVFLDHSIDGVIHLAGFKAVNESIKKPIEYYNNNLIGTFTLTEVMFSFNCKTIIFSSSATIYGSQTNIPIKENFPTRAKNPYARSKIMIEEYLQDIFVSNNNWHIGILRYFNPVGAHKSGLIGEDPKGIPNNLVPFISQVAIGKLKELSIFGADYDTPDGTCIRDYIHVIDIARGHVKALKALSDKCEVLIANLGTGNGYSVLQMIKAFEECSGEKIAYKIVDRRPGDLSICLSDPSYAKKKLGWCAKYTLAEMCADNWNWQKKNPDGFRK